MILVNLLPQEYRARRRTPLKMLIAVASVVAINTSLFAYWAWTAFGEAAEVKSELAVLEDTMQSLRPQIKYHEDLQDESKLFQSREATLKDVTKSRISWTEEVDELIDVIHRGGTSDEKYLIWLDGLTVNNEINERKKTFGELSANGNSGSPKFSHVANFIDDVQMSPLARDFDASSDPEGQQAIKDEELVPSEVWSFPFELTLKSPEARAEARAALKSAQEAATQSAEKAAAASKEGE